jgi:Transposase DNA-binding
MQLLKREFTDLEDMRLLYRGNKILEDLFSSSTHSIRQISKDESSAKGFYRFLSNDRISEEDIVSNLQINCEAACRGKYVLCIQDTTEINLSSHTNRIKKNNDIGTTNVKGEYGLGFMLHPSLVVDAADCIPYGYSDIKIWNRPLELKTKHEREYNKLPIEEKESYKWLEVSKNTKAALKDSVEGMVIVQDREGDIYEQFATIPDEKTDLLIRARTNRKLKDDTKLFTCFVDKPSQGRYEIEVKACKQKKRAKRTAIMEVRYRPITIKKTDATSKGVAKEVDLYLVEAKEVGYEGRDKICWRLLTTIEVKNIELAMLCINWYSWRWTVEEVFKILKKEGYNIEASELEYASSIRKLCVMIMEVTIKLFLMRLAYSEPELDINASTCFTDEEQEYMEHQIKAVEGKTQKQKNPYTEKDLKRYVWLIARLGGWKGYESKRRPGITTLWTGIKNFKMGIEGWHIHRNVSTR